MIKKLFYLTLPLSLTGCVGSLVSGQTEYMGEGYPDIRSVPEREEACQTRGAHETDECTSRAVELEKLQTDWEQLNARNQALREGVFP